MASAVKGTFVDQRSKVQTDFDLYSSAWSYTVVHAKWCVTTVWKSKVVCMEVKSSWLSCQYNTLKVSGSNPGEAITFLYIFFLLPTIFCLSCYILLVMNWQQMEWFAKISLLFFHIFKIFSLALFLCSFSTETTTWQPSSSSTCRMALNGQEVIIVCCSVAFAENIQRFYLQYLTATNHKSHNLWMVWYKLFLRTIHK